MKTNINRLADLVNVFKNLLCFNYFLLGVKSYKDLFPTVTRFNSKTMNEKSFEKEKLKEESLNQRKQLNNQLAVQDQMEQMVKYESGEKSSLSASLNEVGAVSSDSSFFHQPPSYYGSFPSTMSSVLKNNQPVANLDTTPTNYHNLFIKDLRYETRRQLGLRLDLERANVANWKSVADAIGFTNLEVRYHVIQ